MGSQKVRHDWATLTSIHFTSIKIAPPSLAVQIQDWAVLEHKSPVYLSPFGTPLRVIPATVLPTVSDVVFATAQCLSDLLTTWQVLFLRLCPACKSPSLFPEIWPKTIFISERKHISLQYNGRGNFVSQTNIHIKKKQQQPMWDTQWWL